MIKRDEWAQVCSFSSHQLWFRVAQYVSVKIRSLLPWAQWGGWTPALAFQYWCCWSTSIAWSCCPLLDPCWVEWGGPALLPECECVVHSPGTTRSSVPMTVTPGRIAGRHRGDDWTPSWDWHTCIGGNLLCFQLCDLGGEDLNLVVLSLHPSEQFGVVFLKFGKLLALAAFIVLGFVAEAL